MSVSRSVVVGPVAAPIIDQHHLQTTVSRPAAERHLLLLLLLLYGRAFDTGRRRHGCDTALGGAAVRRQWLRRVAGDEMGDRRQTGARSVAALTVPLIRPGSAADGHRAAGFGAR